MDLHVGIGYWILIHSNMYRSTDKRTEKVINNYNVWRYLELYAQMLYTMKFSPGFHANAGKLLCHLVLSQHVWM